MASDDGYGKYRKMLKMGLPRLQVDTCMLMDGKDPKKFVEEDPNQNSAAGSSSSGELDLSLRGDKFDKYRKMLKCGLPMGAAMQAMGKDGVDPQGFEESLRSPPSAEIVPPPASSETSSTTLTETDSNSSGSNFLAELKLKAEKKQGKSVNIPATKTASPLKTPPSSSPAKKVVSVDQQHVNKPQIVLPATPVVMFNNKQEMKKEIVTVTTPPPPRKSIGMVSTTTPSATLVASSSGNKPAPVAYSTISPPKKIEIIKQTPPSSVVEKPTFSLNKQPAQLKSSSSTTTATTTIGQIPPPRAISTGHVRKGSISMQKKRI